MKRLLTCCTLFLFVIAAHANYTVNGVVVSSESNEPIAQVTVSVENSNSTSFTNNNGEFSIIVKELGNAKLQFSNDAYYSKTINVNITDNVNNIGTVKIDPDVQAMMKEDISIMLTENELDDESSSGQIVSGLLGSRGDVFSSTAGYTFGSMRFRVRGLQGEHNTTYINGIAMDDAERGFFTYSQIGGLNDMVRSRENVLGNQAASFAFGNIGGVANINARASAVRKGLKVSQVASNKTYLSRTMATYATGLMENGWAFAASASYRWADEGYVQGTFYDAWGFALAAEKQFGNNHNLSLTILGAPTNRGMQGGSTQEAYDLTPKQTFFRTESSKFGNNFYNPNWGYQNGEMRNSKQVKSFTPIAILSHEWKINTTSKLTTSLGYKYQMDGRTALNWYKAADPRPDYYRNLPNYHITIDDNEAAGIREYMWRTDESYRQVNWDKLYQTNYLANSKGERGNYMIENRRNDQSVITLNSVLNYKLSDRWKLDAGLELQSSKGMHFKLVDDLLGANTWIDIDQFGERDNPGDNDFMQNDLNNPDRVVNVGDKFGYNYDIWVNSANLWATSTYAGNSFDLYFGLSADYSNFWRDGHMKNGRSSDDIMMAKTFNGQVYSDDWYKTVNGSYGASPAQHFLTYAARVGGNYRITGRHILSANVSHGTNAPLAKNAYFSQRIKANVIPNLTPEMYVAADLSYYFRTRYVSGRLTVYNTEIWNASELNSFYNDEYKTFVNFAMYDFNKRHLGAELGVEFKVSPYVTLSAVAAVGQNLYTSNASATVSMENGLYEDDVYDKNLSYEEGNNGGIMIKDFHTDGSPEIATSLGFSYFHPSYWFVDVNVNGFSGTYIDFNPLRRTGAAIEGLDPLDDDDAKLISDIRDQQRVPGGFTVDLSVGKSIRINYKYFININLSVTNLLNNTTLKTGGYEQSRFSTTNDYTNRATYLERFPAKYFYAWGTGVYLNVGFRF